MGVIRTSLIAMRPHQWVKNLLIVVPLLAAHRVGDPDLLLNLGLAVVFFSLGTSAVYLLNDLVDRASDRAHPQKKDRPVASGEMSATWAAALMVALFAVSVGGSALLLPLEFLYWQLGYFVLTTAYSFFLKRRPMLDVLALAALYTIRLLAGGAVVGVEISHWLLAVSMFAFMSLAFLKRFVETFAAENEGGGLIAGRGYYAEDTDLIRVLGPTSGYLAVLVLALYINSDKVQTLYAHPDVLWLACPLVIYWISRIWFIAHRGRLHYDPIHFAVRDWVSWAILACLAAVAVVASGGK